MPKISIIGAGHVGSQAARAAVAGGLRDIVLLDAVPDLARGKALDIMQAQAVAGDDWVEVAGVEDYRATADSDIVVITAGRARRPGMSRSDLLSANAAIVRATVQNAVEWSPDCVLLVVTNPINSMVSLAHGLSGFPHQRVIGMAGVLDNARLRWALAKELKTGTRDVTTWVIGDHGDHMVPVLSQSHFAGRPLRECLAAARIEAAVRRAREGGTEIVEALKSGSASFAPGAAIAEVLMALTQDTPRTLCCSCYLQGEYGVDGTFVGVPARLNRKGVDGIEEFTLDAVEREALSRAVDHIQARNERIFALDAAAID